MIKLDLIRANYRITKEQDKFVKKMAKKSKVSEAFIVRSFINTYMEVSSAK